MLERRYDHVAVTTLPQTMREGLGDVRYVRVIIEADAPQPKRCTEQESIAFVRSLMPKEPLPPVSDNELYGYLYDNESA